MQYFSFNFWDFANILYHTHHEDHVEIYLQSCKKCVFSRYFFSAMGIHFPQNGESEFSYYGKNMAKQEHSKVKVFINISREAEILAIPKVWNERIPI